MEKRVFGKTGLDVTPLAFGTAQLGYLVSDQILCDQLLNASRYK